MYAKASSKILKFLRRLLSTVSNRAFTIQSPHLNMVCSRLPIFVSLAARNSFISLFAVFGNSSLRIVEDFQAIVKKISRLFLLLLKLLMNLTKPLMVSLSKNLKRRLFVIQLYTHVHASLLWPHSMVVLSHKKSSSLLASIHLLSSGYIMISLKHCLVDQQTALHLTADMMIRFSFMDVRSKKNSQKFAPS